MGISADSDKFFPPQPKNSWGYLADSRSTRIRTEQGLADLQERSFYGQENSRRADSRTRSW